MKVLVPPQSGSMHGVTASHNRFGQYTRSKSIPVQPVSSPRRAIARQNFSQASRQFSGIDPNDMPLWNSFGLAHPIVDSLGQTIKLTGHMWYVAINSMRLNLGLATNDTPPVNTAVNALAAVVCVADGTPSVTASWTPGLATDYVVLSASKQMPAGRTFAGTFRQFGFVTADTGTLDLTDLYQSQFGTPQAGQVIFFQLTSVNSDGMSGSPYVVKALVNSGVVFPAIALAAAAGTSQTLTWSGGGTFNVRSELSTDNGNTWILFGDAAAQVSPYTRVYAAAGNLARMKLLSGTAESPYSNIVLVIA